MRRRAVLASLLLVALPCCLPTPDRAIAAGEPQVVQFTPQGTVKKVRQVTARFSDPVVPLGDPRGTVSPFDVECVEPGVGRWVDGRSWAFDFRRDLPAGVRCTFRVKAALKTLAGKPLGGQREFAFSTGGPAVLRTTPWQGSESIDEEQAFVLLLDAEASEASVREHASFAVEGIGERVGARMVTLAARDAILKARFRGGAPGPVVVLQARQRFPDEARVRLVWGKGVTSATGVATEQDQVFEFKVRAAFSVTLECERENARTGCIPITPIRVKFGAPVARDLALRLSLTDAKGKRFVASTRNQGSSLDEITFTGPFPEEAELILTLPRDLKDDAGRKPVNLSQFPLTVKTEPFPPLAKFSARFGIIEAKADPALPVTLRNLEPEVATRLLHVGAGASAGAVTGSVVKIPPDRAGEILRWLRKVAAARRERSVFDDPKGARSGAPAPVKSFQLPKPHGDRAFEVVGVPLAGPGLYVVELESLRLGTRLLGESKPMYVPAAALVTNLAVHVKLGREASLAWVTTLDQGRPVPAARVSVHDCHGAVVWAGQTDEHGIARIAGLPLADPPRCPENDGGYGSVHDPLANLDGGLLVVARTADDMSFAHSGWTQGIEAWRFHLPEDFGGDGLAAHTILDRSLLRAGETVHMKHVLRLRTLRGFSPTPAAERPTRLVISHVGSDERYEFPLAWDAAGIAETEWPIPKTARLGRYEIALHRPRPGAVEADFGNTWTSGEFRVEEFRVPLMKAVLRPPADPLIAVTEFAVDVAVQYLAGGGAAKLPVTLRTQIRPRSLPAFEGFEGFTFGNGFVPRGSTRAEEGAENDDEGEGGAAGGRGGRPEIHQRQSLILDPAGTTRAMVTSLPPATRPMEVLTELEFRDPSGEVQTASTRVPLWPAELLVGIEPESTWWRSRKDQKVRVAVVDVLGQPVAGAPVKVTVFEQKFYSHRKRLVGGLYAYEHVTETREAGELCSGTTGKRGLYVCEGVAPAEGQLFLQASVTDGAGRVSGTYTEVSVGGDDFWFSVRDSDRIDVLPEQRRYEPGDTARLQVQMPFRTATALVTVEREGVLDARVVELSGTDPTVDVPITGSYAPNVFVSVLAVRGRVGDPQPTAMVDLGRPAFKLGIAELRVGWRDHELKVSVSADRPTYRVREKATVRVAVKTAGGAAPPPGTEVAVAAVDEGLLELAPNRTWNLLEAMMARRRYGVTTATAQGHVIGKRHFGLKALPQGGGGGRATTRELFDTLLLWKGRVRLDANGEATLEVPLNDSLTAFRIVAVATGQSDLFGSGATTIRSTQDLMILPGIAPLVREGDRLRSEVTLRNTTREAMDLRVLARVEGLSTPLPAQSVKLPGGDAKVVGWDIAVPVGPRALRYEIEVQAAGRTADRVRVTQEVRAAVPVRTLQATLFQLDRSAREAVKRPADALPGRGGIQVALRGSLVEGLSGVRDWMARYPYTCLEQQVSRSVALRDTALWRTVASTLPAYVDADGLLKYFPTMISGDPVLTAYVVALTHEAGYTIPLEILGRLLDGLRKFVAGAIVRGPALPTADLPIRKLTALDALSRHGSADPQLLSTLTIEPNLWPTSALLDWWGVLQRVATVPDRPRRLAETEQILRARLTLQGTRLGFSTEHTDRLWWLMVSSDANAMRLILHLVQTSQWKDDLPRLVSGALARQQRGAWDLTTANAWGVLAVEKFSAAFEKTPVGGATELSLAGTARRVDWTLMPRGGALPFPWPARDGDLVLTHAGAGRPWVTVQSQAAIPLKGPLGSGYRLTKTLAPIEVRQPGRWTRGDIARVRLTVDAQADMTWVVVSDPIPAGASHLGTGLARDSQIATGGEQRDVTAWPAFEERAFEGYRAYYAYLPKGPLTIEYTIRLNQSGTFALPPTRVEALYAPEMFGAIPNPPLAVRP